MKIKIILSLALLLNSGLSFSQSSCALKDFKIDYFKAAFEKKCDSVDCIVLDGAIVIENKCNDSAGVQLKVVGIDANGNPVKARELWPASIRNISPGKETFSAKFFLDYDPSIVKITAKIIEVKKY